MNIEESINKIKEVIYMSDGTKVDYIDINHMDLGGEVSVDVFIEAIETLLTAYEKEKEKNKELEKDISEMYYKGVVLDILQDELNISRDEAIEILDNY